MNAAQTAKVQLGMWHGALSSMMGECSPEVLNKNPDGTVTSIASIYAHTVFAEDTIVHGMLQGKPTLYQTGGWDGKASVASTGDPTMNPDWAKTVKMDYPAFRDYASAVFAATDAYLDNVSDADLQKKVQTPAGEQTAEWTIAAILATHAPQHAGEIAALKGVEGMKGLPF
ncbi:MAG: DinB family protein [Dehalococcoidia bacterium]